MNLYLLLFWIVAVSAITLAGSWYARKYNRADFLLGIYVAFVVVAQVLAVKISVFDLGFKEFFVPSGVIAFSITFLITDIVNEKFGRGETLRMIGIAFAAQVAMVVFFYIGARLEPAPFWDMQATWEKIFGIVPRITVAGWVAYLISESVDAYIFAWFKKKTSGRYLWMRNAFSTLPSLALDSVVFVIIAFAGVFPVGTLILGQIAVKWMVGIVNIPFMYANRKILSA